MIYPTSPSGCERPDLGPWHPDNPPGQPALHYRLSRYATFLRRMIARLPEVDVVLDDGTRRRPLAALTARATDDPGIALLDAWAVAADVLAFYQERIANEGFLRTAVERRSVLELARAIGYELRPGVSASTYLAFTVDEAPPSPGTEVVLDDGTRRRSLAGRTEALVPAGTAVRSIPAAGELPQTFETAADFTARSAWNTLRPRLTRPQDLYADAGLRYVEGLSPDVEAGDWVLLVRAEDPDDAGSHAEALPRRVLAVTAEPERNRTRLDLDTPPAFRPLLLYLAPLAVPLTFWQPAPLTKSVVQQQVTSKAWRQSDLGAFLRTQRWSKKRLAAHVNFRPKIRRIPPRSVPPQDPLPFEPGLYRFEARLGAFGHNAPLWTSLGLNQRFTSENENKAVPYPNSWDTDPNGLPITRGSDSTQDYATRSGHGVDFYAERVVEGVAQGSWALLQAGDGTPTAVQVRATKNRSLADYSLSAKVTGFDVQKPDGTNPTLSGFRMRDTTIHAASAALPLAELPIEDDVGPGSPEVDQLTLDRLVLDLAAGQPVVLTGERADLPGVTESEVLVLADVFHADGLTTLRFATQIQHPYIRNTVTLTANAVPATHGETVAAEVLGSGDATQAFQAFALRRPPLTYVPAETPSGGAAALTVRVDGVAWDEAPSLFGLGPEDQAYVVRHEDDGTVRVRFGDGREGARLPTGAENVRATYRTGIGLTGHVAEGALTLLAARPPGIRQVTNPVEATGGADPEALADARTNAPRTVLTLDRVVSLRDVEHFTRAFAGVGKARADRIWNGSGHVVRASVSDELGQPFAPASATLGALRGALENASAPGMPVEIAGFRPLFFDVAAHLLVDRAYTAADVAAAARTAVEEAFAFARRAFGQPVTAAEVVALLQDVDGVVAVDLDRLYRTDDAAGPSQARPATVLAAARPHWDGTAVQDAELLLVNPAGITLTTELASA